MERVRAQPADTRRMSIFTEVGLVDENRVKEERSPAKFTASPGLLRPARIVRFRSRISIFNERDEEDSEDDWEDVDEEDKAKDPLLAAPAIRTAASPMMSNKLVRVGVFAFVLAIMLPILSMNPLSHFGVQSATIPRSTIEAVSDVQIVKRDNSPTNACKRWAGQSTVVNGTLYMYGFRTSTEQQQTDNTWSKEP